jgi:hypothetical protein
LSGDPELDELLREVDRLCATREWDALLALRQRARAAHQRGRQHWPAAEYAEYRLALEAPGAYAAQVIVEGAGRFALGPLTEVAASTHGWDELAPWLPAGPLASITAHERVIRGEDLTADDRVDPSVLNVPLSLQEWESSYPVATYRPDKADFPSPSLPSPEPVDLPPPPHEWTSDVDEARSLRGLAATWLAESNGHADAVAVQGAALQAIAALGASSARLAPLTPGQAFGAMAWTGASGGAAGRRRGMAWGRYLAWECASILLQVDIEEVGDHAGELGWFTWDAFEPSVGWSLRLAVEDALNDCAWAVAAVDQA